MTVKIPGYKILGTLGKGGMATVFLAEHEIFQRKVALKVMAQGLAEDPSFGERFMREARIVSQLIHPNIVTVYDVGVHDGCYYLAMEFIDGKDLKHARRHLTLEQKIYIILDIAKALEYAGNKGYVHRDIKPENIMLYTDDSRAVLTDFGIARATEAEISVTQTGTAIGTPHYMSPEQAKGQPVDIRSDIYGLGVVFYLLLVGCVPYDAESAVAIGIKHITDPVPELPEGLEALQPIIDKMMAKLPRDRYQRPAELVEDLCRLDIEALVAAADEAVAREQESLDNASADAPTIISRGAARSGIDRATPHTRRASAAPVDDDPTPVLVETVPFELDEHDSSAWPWVAGLAVLLIVVGGVFYSQYQPQVHTWFAEKRVQFDTLTTGSDEAPPSAIDDEVSVGDSDSVVSRPSGEAGTDVMPDVDAEGLATIGELPAPSSPTTAAPDSHIVERQARIAELDAQLDQDPAVLEPLVTAWRELEAEASEVQSELAISDLITGEVERTQRLAREGKIDAAEARLAQLHKIPDDLVPQNLAELAAFIRQQNQIGQWLAEGEQFLASNALTRPVGDNARARFEQVLTVDPDNARAAEGLAKISARLAALAADAMQKNQPDQAESFIARALEINPQNQQAAQLRQQLADQSRQALQAQVQSLLDKGQAQLREAAYFEPADNNAYHFFSRALTLEPDNKAAREGISRTLREFEERLHNLLAQDHIEVVREMLGTAQIRMPNDERLEALALRVEEAIAEKILATRPRVVNIIVTGGAPLDDMGGEQPERIKTGRTLSVSFRYENFEESTGVIQATLMDGSRTVHIAQVPVVVTGSEGTKTFRIDRPVEGFPPGRYTIDLLFKGNVLAARDFQVE